MAVQGNLREMSLANLIQVNCQEMRSARLTLEQDGQSGEVYFADGQVVHSTCGMMSGQDAVFEMLTWEDGTFTFDRDVHTAEKSISIDWNDLLLEGMQRAAEALSVKTRAQAKKKNSALPQLKAIDGVTGAIISSTDGIVLSADVPESDGEQEAAIAVFMGAAAEQLGEVFGLNLFAHGVVNTKTRRLLVLRQTDRYIGLVIGERSSPTIIANAANEVLRKFPS